VGGEAWFEKEVKSGKGIATDEVDPEQVAKRRQKQPAVHPTSGPGNRENVITIRGQNFGTRAEVYVGSMKACSVKILSRDLIEATLPKCAKNDKDACTKEQDIKVIVGLITRPGEVTSNMTGPWLPAAQAQTGAEITISQPTRQTVTKPIIHPRTCNGTANHTDHHGTRKYRSVQIGPLVYSF
jgi:hypothetical protein